MQETDSIHAQSENTETPPAGFFRRYRFLWLALLVLLLLAIVPPLISVNRYRHRITTSISQSLGRPVHLDGVNLNLLPLPGFTLKNLVVDEDPAFGSEPIIRANSVRVTLRLSSLWTGRVEFSTISFSDPSVNLVHLPNGKWNLESILLQASHIEAAPTAQRRRGTAPRFPYIEATGARLNFKLNQEKIPLSFTNADFALWLSNPQQWRLRLQADPMRTDANVSSTGTMHVEGTLGRAASLAEVPIHLQGTWRDAPLGGASWVLLGRDAGWRGNMTLSANIQGTVGDSAVEAKLSASDARRADFVPKRPLNVELECLGTATNLFHSFNNVRCSWPPSSSIDARMLLVSGSLPDIRKPRLGTVNLSIPGIPADTILDWLHVVNERIPADVSTGGTLTGSLSYRPDRAAHWNGELLITGSKLVRDNTGPQSFVHGDVALRSVAPDPVNPRSRRKNAAFVPAPPTDDAFTLGPVLLALGGKEPATLEGHFDSNGYTLHLTGMVTTSRLLELGAALPAFGDGLAKALPEVRATMPFRADLTAARPWRGTQVWMAAAQPAPARHLRNAKRR